MSIQYDLIVIGAGPAGTPAATAAAMFGLKVLLVDKKAAPGGECLFEGCIPSKVLENAANHYASVAHSDMFHIELDGQEQIHWEKVLQDKDEILKKRSMAALSQINQLPNIDYKQKNAKFMDAHSVQIGDEVFTFKKALIATGGKTAMPNIQGNGIDKVWTNRDVFFEEKLPEEILFIGAGAISCELTQMFNKLGVECHILERSERILKHLSEDSALSVQKRMVESGIKLDLNVALESVDFEKGVFHVTFTQDGKSKTVTNTNVLMATGRIANVDGLGLENAGVEYDKNGVIVNEKLQSSQPDIYACGDAIKGPKFAHTASYEAGIVVHNMFSPSSPHRVDFSKNSWVLFSDPQVGVAGIDEQTAKKDAMDVDIEIYDYAQDARAQIDKQTVGFVKFVIDKKTKVIVGVEIVSEDASSLIGEASLIVANKMTAMDVMSAIHPHPTLTESFGKLAQQIFLKSMMKRG